ncbi:MAG: permease prefix domain 1-containing protein [Nitriliruptor sp.]
MVADLEAEIAEWRAFVERSPAVDRRDVDELEAHLRDQVADLDAAGLSEDEAFLIAVKRIGNLDEVAREYAREHSDRLWKQLVLGGGEARSFASGGLVPALAFAIGAEATVQVARLLAGFTAGEPWWLLRNAALFVLPFLAGYFAWRRELTGRQWLFGAAPVALGALAINLYPFGGESSSTGLLAAAHLPVLLWFAVAYPYMGGAIRSRDRRMDFVRFTGEWLIYYVLIALGGGVLMGLTVAILEPAGIDSERVVEWVLPVGAAGAVVVAAWLVESKQRVVENMAPVLTMIFTPLFALMLVLAAVIYAVTGVGGAFDREVLAVFDALMVVVLGLVLYGMSARDPDQPPGWMDRIQLVAVLGALALNLMVLGMMVARISELGFTPNRTAALGLNLLLLVNLAGAAWLSSRFLIGAHGHHRLERWQTAYLPTFAAWTAAVVVVLPPLFSFR